jgi:putative ABC transport system permease protein
MLTVLGLAVRSLRSRALTTSLTVFSIALSVLLLVGVDRLRSGAQQGFAGTLSQTDLVVGARGGSLPLLLYTVFHIGYGSNDISIESYNHFHNHPAVAWTIPFSLGDSHRGFRVVATDHNFYEHYRFRRDHSIQLAEGHEALGIFDAVLGSDVAATLHYHLGSQIVLAHGIEAVSFQKHTDKPFTVVGILAHTATPVDRAIYITLLGDEAMHVDWKDGAPPSIGEEIPASKIRAEDLHVDQVSSFLVRTKSRVDTLLLQREINTYKAEPLSAIIPAFALQDLWGLVGYADVALSIVSGAVLVVGLLAMLASLYTALNERRREVAVLRAVGLHRGQIFSLFVLESTLISALGTLIGIGSAYALLALASGPIEQKFGIPLALGGLSTRIMIYAAVVVVAGAILGAIPALRAYRNSLIDGLNAN